MRMRTWFSAGCVAVLASVAIMALQAADAPSTAPGIGRLPAARVLFLGNSITLHGPAPQIGWTGNWGMAASAPEKDYVHLVTADIAKATGTTPEIKVRNIADFERGHATFDVQQAFQAEREFQPDLIIIAIGENVPGLTTDEAKAHYATAFGKLLASFKDSGKPALFVRSSFWADSAKDDIMRAEAAKVNATFVDISTLNSDKANSASSERQFDHAGVAAHPGDRGMRAIADAIYKAIQKTAE